MIRLDERRIFLAIGVTDMRKAINGLGLVVEQHLALNLFSGDVFAFSNRRRNLIKLLVWDRNGFWLFHKRLETERFTWPESEAEVAEISVEKLGWLLAGLDIEKAHGKLPYSCLN